MRLGLAVIALCAAATQLVNAQHVPPDNLYRGPLYVARPARYIEPKRLPPVGFTDGTFSGGIRAGLLTTAKSQSVRSLPVSGIMLRLAYGPTRHGMVTVRLRPATPDRLEPQVRISPGDDPRPLNFVQAAEDPPSGMLALNPQMEIVFTVERVEDVEGHALYENPDATELLWNALGRPTLSDQ